MPTHFVRCIQTLHFLGTQSLWTHTLTRACGAPLSGSKRTPTSMATDLLCGGRLGGLRLPWPPTCCLHEAFPVDSVPHSLFCIHIRPRHAWYSTGTGSVRLGANTDA